MIFSVLLLIPMALFYIFRLFIEIVNRWNLFSLVLVQEFLFVLLYVINLAFLPEKMLKIVSGLYLLFMSKKYFLGMIFRLALWFNDNLGGLYFNLWVVLLLVCWIRIWDWYWDMGIRIQHSLASKDFKKL